MFIEAVLLSSLLFGGSKLYEKIIKPDKKKNKINKSEKSLSFYTVKEKEITDLKSSVEIADRSEISELTRQNQFDNTTINKYLTVISVSTLMTVAGRIFYAPLIPLGVLGLLYPYTGIVRRAYNGLVNEKKIKMPVMGAILLPGMILTRYYFTTCFSLMLYYTSLKLLNKIEDNSRQNVVNFFENQPGFVWIVKDGIEIEIPFESLRTGDIASVKAGESIPADGIITEGTASVDQHILTGESMPLEKGAGDPVFASTVVLSGRLLFRVEKSGKETVVANIADILNRTVDYKTGIQSKGEKITDQSIVPTMALSVAALPVAGPAGMLAVLNSYIGADVSILVPLSTLNFLKAASNNSILIKDGRSLELLSKIDTVVFDKTGTLTIEQLVVLRIHTCDGLDETKILLFAAMAEQRQTHPIAKAILKKARECGINPGNVGEAFYEIGYGIRVRISDTVIRVGSVRFMEMEGIEIPDKINDIISGTLDSGNSLVMVAKENRLVGAIELHPTVRPEVRSIINSLKKRNKSLYIISGDNTNHVKIMAEELGIDNYFSEIFPEQKAQIIEQLQKEGRSVCFIGDGINDSIAMKKAHVSVSLSGASTVATDTANIILMDGTLCNLDKIFEIAKDFDKNINTALAISIVPGIMNIASVFFLNTGIYFALGLYYIFLPLGVGNSFVPMIKYKKKKELP
ncbi:MAG: heavy metal translocating P-type ATPase [Desulfamplus sp.]|nr:heavy metal translocating P-type ATPase [Desulfamplus sp.]